MFYSVRQQVEECIKNIIENESNRLSGTLRQASFENVSLSPICKIHIFKKIGKNDTDITRIMRGKAVRERISLYAFSKAKTYYRKEISNGGERKASAVRDLRSKYGTL